MKVLDNLPVISTYSGSVSGNIAFPLRTAGRYFYDDNDKIVSIKGFSSFKAIDFYSKGEDIRSVFNQYEGYNSPRIFLYTNPDSWHNDAWDIPSNDAISSFINEFKNYFIKLILCTDGDYSKLNRIKEVVYYLKPFKFPNLFLEAVNEPYVEYNGNLYGKIDPNEFRNILAGSGYLYSSGVYANNHRFYGNVWLDHSSRNVPGWADKGGHNLKEAFNGGGPNDPSEPALKIPGIEDEPIRPDQCNYDFIGFYSYAASLKLFGGSGIFHSTPGKLCKLLGLDDIICKDYFLKGLNIFPDGIGYGSYNRIIEPGQTEYARTYVVGDYSIRIDQVGKDHPENGWKSLDEFGICWSR